MLNETLMCIDVVDGGGWGGLPPPHFTKLRGRVPFAPLVILFEAEGFVFIYDEDIFTIQIHVHWVIRTSNYSSHIVIYHP